MLLIPLVVLFVIVLLWNATRVAAFIQNYRRKKRLSSTIPGPSTLGFLGNIHQLHRDSIGFAAQLLQYSNELTAKGNSLLRYWVGDKLYVFALDAETVKPLLESSSEITKGNDYDFLRPWLGDGLLTSTDGKWHSRRKMLTPSFHYGMLDAFVSAFDTESQILVEQLNAFADTGVEFDALPFVKRCTLDIICMTAMGTKLNSQIDHDSSYFRAVERIACLLFEHLMTPWYWIPPVWYATGRGFQRDNALRTLNGFTKQVIGRRSLALKEAKAGGAPKRLAFLDMLLNMQEANKLTAEDIEEEVNTFMFEGHDTTASGIGWTLWCLATHPEIQERAKEEIDQVLGDGEVSFSSRNLKELRYLERCIKEAMRVFPPVPFVQRILKNDLEMAGSVVPKGTNCMIAPLVLHRNPKLYSNPDVYNPDNFLPEEVAKRHPYAYIPFSAGPRNCIGQKFALLEELTVIARVIRAYRVSTSFNFGDNPFGTEAILRPARGIPISVQRRKPTL